MKNSKLNVLRAITMGSLLSFSHSFCSSAEIETAYDLAAQTSEGMPSSEIVSEAFGHMIAKNLDNPGFEFKVASVIKGMQDSAKGIASPLNEVEYEKAIAVIQKKSFDELSQTNLEIANTYMEKNASLNDINQLVPGKLHISVLEEGCGSIVSEHSTPLVHYTGRYADNTVFGSSKEGGQPIPLQLDQAILGFSKGLVGAKEGETRRLYIHPDLAYGASDVLPPNSILIFDIEVVKADAGLTDSNPL